MAEPPSRVRVKVCGLTTVADAVACAEAGADWIGLNFHPASSRFIGAKIAAEIVAALPSSCEAVGLFVDRPPSEVIETAERIGLKTVQLHGSEPPTDLVAYEGVFVIRAFRIGGRDALERMTAYLDESRSLGRTPDAVLIDGYVAGVAGGTGQSIAVDLLDDLPPLPRLILAGGLTPENVADRVARARPWMVDVASGVESTPGRKDVARVSAFVSAARGDGSTSSRLPS